MRTASIRVDSSYHFPHEVAEKSRGDSRTGVFVGTISGPATVRTFGDSPFDPRGISGESLAREQYTFLVLPVSSEAPSGETSEVWLELGLVHDPQASTEDLVADSPSAGTPILAAGSAHENKLVLSAAHAIALQEADGSTAVAYRGALVVDGEPVDLDEKSFDILRGLTLAAISSESSTSD